MQCPALDELTPAHLSECERCRRAFAVQQGLSALLCAAEEEVAVPPGFQARLSAHLDRVQVAPERGRLAARGWAGRLFRGVGVAACLVLACLPLILRGQGQGVLLSRALAEHHAACWALPSNARCLADVKQWGESH